ncbi:DUF721 domain-containing protein [Actinomyces minihominis]|uniref:DUF721 domain-containing protein n=1 Tax=Actinomyces minihominis TaxID=2002838 RepID=UPI001F5DCB86|nr:DciA family protein [Actinomyces minihominis]
MSDQDDELRRAETAKSFYRKQRAQVFEKGNFTSPSVQKSAGGVADFGKTPNPKSNQTQGPGNEDVTEEEFPGTSSAKKKWTPPPGTYRSKTGPGRSRWDPQLLGDVLGMESKKRGWTSTLSVASVTADWEEIVGPQVAAHCPIESFEGGTLIARADSTAWAQQLQLLLPHIHRRIDERVGAGVVDKVIVRGPQAPSWTRGKRTYRGGRGPRDTYG